MEDKEIVKKLEKVKAVKKSMRSHMKTAMGDVENWDANKMRKAKHMVGGMDIKDLRKLTKESIKGAMADLKDVKFKRGDARAAISKKIMESLGGKSNASEWSSDDIIK